MSDTRACSTMQTVRDDDGETYLLVKRSAESSRVRDPETGEERYVDNDDLRVVDGESPLATAASGVPEPVRRTLGAVRDDRSLGLLAVVVDEGPIAAIDLLDASDWASRTSTVRSPSSAPPDWSGRPRSRAGGATRRPRSRSRRWRRSGATAAASATTTESGRPAHSTPTKSTYGPSGYLRS